MPSRRGCPSRQAAACPVRTMAPSSCSASPGSLVLARIDVRAAGWLVVPAIWPSTQFHYSTLAMPVMHPILAMGLALPLPGLPLVVITIYAGWRALSTRLAPETDERGAAVPSDRRPASRSRLSPGRHAPRSRVADVSCGRRLGVRPHRDFRTGRRSMMTARCPMAIVPHESTVQDDRARSGHRLGGRRARHLDANRRPGRRVVLLRLRPGAALSARRLLPVQPAGCAGHGRGQERDVVRGVHLPASVGRAARADPGRLVRRSVSPCSSPRSPSNSTPRTSTCSIVAAVLIGFRHPWAWAFVALTKVTPGVGMLWFAVRREWRNFAIAARCDAWPSPSASWLAAPDLWRAVPRGAGVRTGRQHLADLVAPAAAALVVVWGARNDHRWALIVAVFLAMPRWYFLSPVILVGLFTLVSAADGRCRRRRSPAHPAQVRVTFAGALDPSRRWSTRGSGAALWVERDHAPRVPRVPSGAGRWSRCPGRRPSCRFWACRPTRSAGIAWRTSASRPGSSACR